MWTPLTGVINCIFVCILNCHFLHLLPIAMDQRCIVFDVKCVLHFVVLLNLYVKRWVYRTYQLCSTRLLWWILGSWRLPSCSPRWTASCSRMLTVCWRTIDYLWDATIEYITTLSVLSAIDTGSADDYIYLRFSPCVLMQLLQRCGLTSWLFLIITKHK